MNDILPFVEQLIRDSLLTSTTLTQPLLPGEIVLHVDSAKWFWPSDEVAIGDDRYACIHYDAGAVDTETNEIILYESPGIEYPIGTRVCKTRAVNPPKIHVGNFSGPLDSFPIIRIKGRSQRSEPLSIGGDSLIHEVEILVLAEKEAHCAAYLEMLAWAKEIYYVLLKYKDVSLGTCRCFYACRPEIDLDGEFHYRSAVYSAGQILFTMSEEFYTGRATPRYAVWFPSDSPWFSQFP